MRGGAGGPLPRGGVGGIVARARQRAVEVAAAEGSRHLAKVEETPLSHLLGNAIGISVKMVEELSL